MSSGCYVCGDPDVIEYHHIIPRSLGGGKHEGVESPLAPLCAKHHALLHKMAKGGNVPDLSKEEHDRMMPLVRAIHKAARLKEARPELFQDRQLHTLNISITPVQLARLHKLKAERGFTSLDSFLQSVIAGITKTANRR